MTPDVYADVDPDAKKAAVSKIDQKFHVAYAEQAAATLAEEYGAPKLSSMPPSSLLSQAPEKEYNPALESLMSEATKDMPAEVLRYLVEQHKRLQKKKLV